MRYSSLDQAGLGSMDHDGHHRVSSRNRRVFERTIDSSHHRNQVGTRDRLHIKGKVATCYASFFRFNLTTLHAATALHLYERVCGYARRSIRPSVTLT